MRFFGGAWPKGKFLPNEEKREKKLRIKKGAEQAEKIKINLPNSFALHAIQPHILCVASMRRYAKTEKSALFRKASVLVLVFMMYER